MPPYHSVNNWTRTTALREVVYVVGLSQCELTLPFFGHRSLAIHFKSSCRCAYSVTMPATVRAPYREQNKSYNFPTRKRGVHRARSQWASRNLGKEKTKDWKRVPYVRFGTPSFDQGGRWHGRAISVEMKRLSTCEACSPAPGQMQAFCPVVLLVRLWW